MNQVNRRKYDRQESLNLLNFEVLDSKGKTLGRGMGRTLNVSEKGISLEVYIPMQQGDTVLVTLGLEEDMVEIKGKVIYVNPGDDHCYVAGLKFVKIDKQGAKVLKKYLKAFKESQTDF
jgi:hypothetical protein